MNAKKLISLVLALMLVLAISATAMADDTTYTLTLNNAIEGYTYTAYQIFAGTLNDSVLTDIVWGSGVTDAVENALGDAAEEAEKLTTTVEAEAFADKVAEYLDEENGISATVAENATTCQIEGLEPGYYLVRNDTVPEGGVYTDYMMLVVKSITANVKAGVPTGGKQITGDDNDIASDIASDGESDNVSIGSAVKYTLTGTVPAEASYYDYYYFVFNDTLSKGLTYNEDVAVTIGSAPAAEDTDYAVYTETVDDGTSIKVAMLDAKAAAGKTITVTYSATLNENAVIGTDVGNVNTLTIDYSNNPNQKYDGTQDDDNPGLPDSDKNVPTGSTPTDTVRTYTTGLKLIKVDENGNTLTGATFEIKGDNLVEILTVEAVTYKVDVNGTYWKLADGSYTTEEPITANYMEVKTARDSGYVETTDTTREGYIAVDGMGYAIATEDELAGTATLYKLIESNADAYDSTETKYAIDTVTYSSRSEITGKTYTQAVGNDGTLILAGLGEGTYTITETAAPNGYNMLSGPITVEINWTEVANEDTNGENCTWDAISKYGNETKTLNLNEGGIFELEIENKSGATLPTTGGMGTTMIYIAGGLLVAAAVILLITKRRAGAAE